MKIYISGQITCEITKQPIPNFEDKFEYCKIVLERAISIHVAMRLLSKMNTEFVDVINPCILPHKHERTWKAFMKEDLNALKTCTHLYAMKCWKKSRGARIEVWFAKRYGIEIIYQS